MKERIEQLIGAGKLDEALALAHGELSAARATDDDARLACALVDEACAQLAHGDRDDAVMTVDEAISKARRTFGAQDARYAEALELGAEVAAASGMPHSADARFRAAIEILETAAIGGPALAHALYHHGAFRRAQGDAAGAGRAFVTVLQQVGKQNDARSLSFAAMALTALGELALEAGRDEEARKLGDRALELWLEVGQARRFEVGDAMTLVGRAALRERDLAVAEDFLATAIRVYQGCKIDVRARHAVAATAHAHALDALGRKPEALAAFERALDLYREGDPARMDIEQRILELAKG